MDATRYIAIILAGGRGRQLGGLTYYYAKPSIHFGGNHRLIDFALNNCRNAGIETIGVLSQYLTTNLHEYIGAIRSDSWENDAIHMLSSEDNTDPYKGTADAVYRNIAFIDRFMPDHVLILPGSHIYEMDYAKMMAFHEHSDADVTIASTPVAAKSAAAFGILDVAKDRRVRDLARKPTNPKSNLASMGVYIFKREVLKKYLLADSERAQSQHDFSKNIVPHMLSCGERVFTYRFSGYWRDIRTVDSLWKANMDQIDDPVAYGLGNGSWNITSLYSCDTPIKIYDDAVIRNSIFSGGCSIFGKLEHSVLSDSVTVGMGSEVVNSVVMPGVYIGNNVRIRNTVIGPNAQIMDNTAIGSACGTGFFVDRRICPHGVSLVAPWLHIAEGMRFQEGSHIHKERLAQYEYAVNEENTQPFAEQLDSCIPSASFLLA